jgi:hypothetical protein
MHTDKNSRISHWLIAFCLSVCLIELFWFSSKCFHQIDFDGMSYIGIARHLRHGEFHASINAFRSPVISWLIALASFASPDYLLVGKLISIAAFLLSVGLLFVLTDKLWHSRVAASVAALIFSLGRGLGAMATQTITPDFLFAALTLVYFIVLLRCLRRDRPQDWLLLGLIHGLAFLTKAFALPWLAVCTLVALAFSCQHWKKKLARLALAALIPVLVAAGWSTVLHSRYGVFTTGTQFKVNLLQWTLHAYSGRPDPTYALLRDTTRDFDEYCVGDIMPPGSWPWKYRVRLSQVLPEIIRAEVHNVPRVLKEMVIVTTLGSLIAFVAMLAILTRRRLQYPVEWRFAIVVGAGAVSLVLAYSMLVFDERYLYPVVPLLLAIAARFLVPAYEFNHARLRQLSVALVILGSIAALVYPSSPYRLLTRDFQASLYDVGDRLRSHPGATVVSIGSGPFPEHGIGWEAGYKATFFGDRRIIGTLDTLPASSQLASLASDIRKASPDVILVWGRPNDAKYEASIGSLRAQYPQNSNEKITDPVLGEVGTILFPGVH